MTVETIVWAIFVAITAVWVYGLNLVRRWQYRHIPGPPPKWLLGNAAEIKAKMMHGSYEQWSRKHGPVCRIFLGMQPIVIITDPDLMREVIVRQFMTFHDRPPWPLPTANGKIDNAIEAWMVQAKGSYWTSLRAAAQPLFHSDRLASFAPSMADAAEEQAVILAHAADSGEPVDMQQHLARITLNVTGTTVFGLDFKLQAAGQQGVEMPMVAAWKRMFNISLSPVMVAKAILPTLLQPLVTWLAAALGEKSLLSHEDAQTVTFESSTALMDNAWRDFEKRGVKVTAMREPGWRWWRPSVDPMQGVVPSEKSLISLMLRATNKETGRGLTDKEVAAQVNTFMAAGYETTSTALTFAVALLARHPEAEQKLVAEIDALGGRNLTAEDIKLLPYTEAVLYEAMRVYPPLPVMGRVASKTTHLGGYRIPKGTVIHYNIWGIQRDAQHWPDPCAFRPERFLQEAESADKRRPHAFVAFGLGPRVCIGQKFAVQEAILVLARLYRDVSFKLTSDQPLELREGLTIAPKYGLPVRVVRRNKAS